MTKTLDAAKILVKDNCKIVPEAERIGRHDKSIRMAIADKLAGLGDSAVLSLEQEYVAEDISRHTKIHRDVEFLVWTSTHYALLCRRNMELEVGRDLISKECLIENTARDEPWGKSLKIVIMRDPLELRKLLIIDRKYIEDSFVDIQNLAARTIILVSECN